MRTRLLSVVVFAVVVVSLGCECCTDSIWFKGSFDAAAAAAESRETLILLDFYTDWCTWCRRLDKETFTDEGVRAELRELVALKVNAEQGGEELARRYAVSSYPTLVFVNSQGDEVDRIYGYLPADEFRERVRRIRAGDTFVACLERLDDDPADLEALCRSVTGLLDRSDPQAALARVRAYHAAGGCDGCAVLLFQAGAMLHSRAYDRAAKVFRRGWDVPLGALDDQITPALIRLDEEGGLEGGTAGEAERLRQARHDDAGALLAMVKVSSLTRDELFGAARFAFANGHYDTAAALALEWYRRGGKELPADELGEVAWNLYLSHRELDTAIEMARLARSREPSASVSDTLGRLLYAAGQASEAKEVQREAVRTADQDTVESYRSVLKKMEAGEPLDDRPGFEHYPDG